jgi:hypothetical protein
MLFAGCQVLLARINNSHFKNHDKLEYGSGHHKAAAWQFAGQPLVGDRPSMTRTAPLEGGRPCERAERSNPVKRTFVWLALLLRPSQRCWPVRVTGQRYSKVWFNTPSQTTFARSTPAQIRQWLQKFGIKPDDIIGPKVRNFLSNEPPIKLTQRLRYRQASLLRLTPRRLIYFFFFPLFCHFFPV